MKLTNTVLSVLALALLPAAAAAQAEEMVADYRDPTFRTEVPKIPEEERAAVLATLLDIAGWVRTELGADPHILGRAQGSFSVPGAVETAYLVSAQGPVSVGPASERRRTYLAVLDAEGVVIFAVANPELPYARLVGAADPDGDGRDGLLLEASLLHMGQVETRLDLVALDEDRVPELVQTLVPVYAESCGVPLAGDEITAAAIVIENGALAMRPETLPC